MVDTKGGLNIIVGGFIAILLGVVLVQVIADSIKGTETINTVTNESFTLTTTNNAIVNESVTLTSQIGNTGNTSVIKVSFFGNGTNSTDLAAISFGTEVNVSRDGQIIVAAAFFGGSGPYNITYNYTSVGTGTLDNEDIDSGSFFGNATISTHLTGIAVGTEVNFSRTGTVAVSTYNFTAGTYNASYTYEDALFTAKTLLGLTTIFFVIAILLIGFALVKKSLFDVM